MYRVHYNAHYIVTTSYVKDSSEHPQTKLASKYSIATPHQCCNAGGGGGSVLGSVFGLAKGLFQLQSALAFVKDLYNKACEFYEKYSPVFTGLSYCFQGVWECVQLWTPLTVTFIFYWLIYRPDRFHPRVESAVLAALDVTNSSTTAAAAAAQLWYGLDVDLSFRNSRLLTIRYLDVAASLFYDGTRLGPTDDALPSFRQRHSNETVLHLAFHDVVAVDSGVAAELKRERAAGTVHLRVTVSLTLMYKVLFVKDVFFYKYDCWLWFPPPRNHTPALFHGQGTKCWRAHHS